MEKLVEKALSLDASTIQALVFLGLVFTGYQIAVWYMSKRDKDADLATTQAREAAKTRRRENRNQELADQLAGIVTEQRVLHEKSHADLLTMFREDRKAFALSFVKILEDNSCFEDEDRGLLLKVHNAHLGPGARRSDGSLRFHGSAECEAATLQARDDARETRNTVRKIHSLQESARDHARDTVAALARLEARP